MRWLLSVLISLTLLGPAQAAKPEWVEQGKPEAVEKAGKGDPLAKERRAVADRSAAQRLPAVLRHRNRETVLSYYQRHPEVFELHPAAASAQLPPGLRKKLARGGSLPPGWQKKLARGEALSDELRADAVPVPHDLVRALPVDPAVEEVLRIQDKVIRVTRGQGTVIDVIDLADVVAGRRMRREGQ